MAQDWQAFPSAVTNSINRYTRPVVDPHETVGSPLDRPAVSVDDENSMFALAKGILREIGAPEGAGEATVNISPRTMDIEFAALGEMTDPPATDAAYASGISLLKGILAAAVP